MINRKYLAGSFLIAIGLSLGFGIGSLRAQGVPQTDPLFYSGTLIEDGQPVTGAMRNIRISLWKSETSTMVADRTCETVANSTPVEGGRFRVALDASCVTAVHAEPEQWVEVLVGADIIGGRAKLGAVPYALEADRASNAAGALAAQVTMLQAQVAALEAASPNESAFRARASTVQDISSATVSQVYFATEEWDTDNEFDPVTSLFTAKSAGYYDISCALNWNIPIAGTTGYWEAHVYVNGVRRIVDGFQGDGRYAMQTARSVLRLAIGDQVGCSAWHDSGAPRPLNAGDTLTIFSAIRLAP